MSGWRRSKQEGSAGRDANIAGRDQFIAEQIIISVSPAEVALAKGQANSQVVVGDVPQEPPGFLARAELLAILDACGPGVLVVQAVTGMRGVGKTQLAAAIARAKLAEGWRLVAWVNAEDAASLAGGLAAVAEALELAGPVAGAGGGDPGRAVRHWLEAGGDQCLLVFDNATSADALRPYVPAGGAARILITSYRKSVAELGGGVGVEVFTQEEAAEFLAERTTLTDPAGAGELARELGYLPLALAQAAAVIRGQRLTYGTYLERLRALPVAEYMIRQDGQPYPHGVAETVLLSLEAVRAVDRAGTCARVMELLGVLSASGVRRDLLYAAGSADALGGASDMDMGAAALDEALGRLAERSLLSFSQDRRAVLAHRLVLRVVRDALARQGRLAAVCQVAAAALRKRAAVLDPWADRPAVRDIAAQVTALADTTGRPECQAGDELVTMLLQLRARALYYLDALEDSAAQAIAVGERLAADLEQLMGAEHAETLTARDNLAIAYRDRGRVAEAITLHKQVMRGAKRTLGEAHPSTIACLGHLAEDYLAAGLPARAIPLHEQALTLSQGILGEDHPSTLTVLNNLAQAYCEAGRAAEAIPLYEQVLAARERGGGPDDFCTLTALVNLALGYRAEGRVAEAIPLHERAVAACERVLGADHPRTLVALNNLAAAQWQAGRASEAIRLHEQNLAACERVLGARNHQTLTAGSNLAVAYWQAGRVAEAIDLLERTLADRRRILNSGHPDILNSRDNLANAYLAVGRAAEAVSLLEQNLADRVRLLGPDHPDTRESRDNLAIACQAGGGPRQSACPGHASRDDTGRAL